MKKPGGKILRDLEVGGSSAVGGKVQSWKGRGMGDLEDAARSDGKSALKNQQNSKGIEL
jgi:hypothetical protein